MTKDGIHSYKGWIHTMIVCEMNECIKVAFILEDNSIK